MFHSVIRTLFIASLGVALLGGMLLIACQAVGLIAGGADLVTGPNGMFKNTLCIAASLAAVSGYALVQVADRALDRRESEVH